MREWSDYDGTVNLQNALDSGEPLVVGDDHVITHEGRWLGVSSGLDLEVRGEIRKAGSPNSGGTTGSFIRNKSFAEKVTDVHIHGTGMDTPGGIIGAVDHTKTANVFGLWGDRILIEHTVTDCWAGGRYMIPDGDNNVVRWNKAYGSPKETNCGGIRLAGGDNFQCYGNDVWSGDDTYQCVPDGSTPSSPLYDHTITNAYFGRNTGGSWMARFLVVGIQNRDQNPDVIDLTCSVRGVMFDRNHGIAGRCATVLQNINSSGVIDDVWYVGGSVDCGPSEAPVMGQEVYVNANPNAGGVRNVYTHRHPVLNKRAKQLTRRVGTPENVNLDGFTP